MANDAKLAPPVHKFESLLPSNSTDLEFALEKVTARAFTDTVDTETIWNPDTCPAELLPWLAWSLSVDGWEDGWSDSIKRNVIKSSLFIHKIKGTRRSVEEAVAAIGGNLKIWECWEKGLPKIKHANGTLQKLKPFQFFIEANVSGQSPVKNATVINQLKAAIDATKPVRSTYFIALRVEVSESLNEYSFVRAAVHRRIKMETK